MDRDFVADFPLGRVRTLRKLLPEELDALIERHQAFIAKYPYGKNPTNGKPLAFGRIDPSKLYAFNEALEEFGAPSTAFCIVDNGVQSKQLSHAETMACFDIIDHATVPMFDLRGKDPHNDPMFR